MKKLILFLLLLIPVIIGYSQNLGNPQQIGQTTRNQKVGKGFQIEDTLLAKGKVRYSALPTAGSGDTVIGVMNTSGYFSKVNKSSFLNSIGTQTLSISNDTLTISGGNSVVLPIDSIRFGFNTGLDSLVFCQEGVRYAVPFNPSLYLTATSTNTLTNKRITPRVDSTTSSATPTINTDNVDTYKLTAQAADITSFTTNLSGTPKDDQILHIVIIGTGARAITWGSKFEASTVALPTTTVSTNRLDVYFIWNTATSKWRCGGVW